MLLIDLGNAGFKCLFPIEHETPPVIGYDPSTRKYTAFTVGYAAVRGGLKNKVFLMGHKDFHVCERRDFLCINESRTGEGEKNYAAALLLYI